MIFEKSCGAVVFREDETAKRRYLILKMRKGHFSLCKGHVEGEETEHETARREILEETGLNVVFLGKFRETIEYSPYSGAMKTVVFFLARTFSETFRAQESEVSEIFFLPLEEALGTLTFESDREVLRKADAALED